MGPVTRDPSLPEDKPAEVLGVLGDHVGAIPTLEKQACLCLLLEAEYSFIPGLRGQKGVQGTAHLFLIWACSWQTSR